MEIIYNWLLHNTGNEGNYLTILNVQRHSNDGEAATLEVMARTKEFAVIDLLIKPSHRTDKSADLQDESLKESHFFATEDQVVTYLSKGENTESISALSSDGIGVYMLVPISDAG